MCAGSSHQFSFEICFCFFFRFCCVAHLNSNTNWNFLEFDLLANALKISHDLYMIYGREMTISLSSDHNLLTMRAHSSVTFY